MKEAKKLTKAEVVENISNKTGIQKIEVLKIIDSFFEEINSGLLASKTFEFRGFGTFETRLRAGNDNARNPKTGEIVSVKAHNVAIWRPGKNLKESLWELKN